MFSKYPSSTITLKAKYVFKIFLFYFYFAQKPVSAKAEFKKNRDGMGFMIEGDVRIRRITKSYI